MKKILVIVCLNLLGVSQSFGGWDQSLWRWESDCNYGSSSGCSIAGTMGTFKQSPFFGILL